MNTTKFNIRIEHEKFGQLLNETFIDAVQFKLFLKMVDGCVCLNNDLTFFNGVDFFVNVPHKFLKESIILTSTEQYELADHMKSKIEALVTK